MLRKRGRKMTQADLAELVELSDAQIGFYESETNEPSYETWVKLAQALRVTPGELMFGLPIEEEPEPLGASRKPQRMRKGAG